MVVGVALATAMMVPPLSFGAGPDPVDLGTAGRFLLLSGAAITSTGGGFIYGDVGASPINGASIGLNSAQVVGTIFAVDATGPAGSVVDPGMLGIAKADLTTAYDDASGRLPAPSGAFLNPGGGNLGGQNLVPGLYKFSSSALLTGGDLTLTGGAEDVWIFQISSDLLVDPGMQVILVGGAQARNIFWQVGTSATIGTSAIFRGTIMADQSITLDTSSVLEGRALASIAQITFNGTSVGLSASVGDYVWDDNNMDGIQDSGETGHMDVVVNLYDADTNMVATTNTDANGLYVFADLVPGLYSLEFVQPAGLQFTSPGQGGEALDSDADLLTGRTEAFMLFAGEFNTNWDAGLISSNAAPLITKRASVDPVRPSEILTYTITVSNATMAVASNVTVVETYDAFYRYLSSTPEPLSGTSNTWYLGDLPIGFATNIVVTGRVRKNATSSNDLSNTAAVFSDLGNRTVTVTTRVISSLPIPVTLLYFRAVDVEGGVKLKWETATESDNLGFNLYRSETTSGKRLLVNGRLVPGSTASEGKRYRFLDASAKPGVTYAYWLEEVAVNYKTVTYGPAMRLGFIEQKPAGILPALGVFRTTSTGGLYRIRFETLATAGLTGTGLDPNKLAVRIKGVKVPVFVSAAGPEMVPGDGLMFYASASPSGRPCEVVVDPSPLRMSLADARPVRGPGEVYMDQAGARQRLKFFTDPAIVRYFLIDFTDLPVWVLDVTRPMNAIMMAGYSCVGIENGLTAVLMSYDSGSNRAKCVAIQDSAVLDVGAIRKP
ncbi:MAG: ice-binding family protein [Kiritimatiellia bacterium]